MSFHRKLLCIGLFLGLLVVTSAASAASAQTCSTADCHADYAGFANQHAPVADGECEACHQQVQDQHPAAEGKSFELVAQGGKLCYQCHDAFGRKLNLHKALAGDGCVSCHDPHGRESGRMLLGVDHDLSGLCFQCHDSKPFEGEVQHGPSASGECTECHDPHEANMHSLLKAPLEENCARCHDEMAEGLNNAPHVHSAVKESECTECHNPHSSPAQDLLQTDLESLCLECHKIVGRQAKGAKTKHAALYRDEKCSACHSTHYSQYPYLLLDEEKEVCLSCHGVDNFSKSNPLKNIAKELAGKALLHGPLQDGQCSGCHNPHGSDNARLLLGKYPASFYHPYKNDSYDFCLRCHDKNMLRFPETSIYTEFRNGNQNLHFVHVTNKYKGRTCRACHESHAANSEKLMNDEGAQFGNWKVPTRFVKTDTGGSCSPGCHRTYEYDRDEPVEYAE